MFFFFVNEDNLNNLINTLRQGKCGDFGDLKHVTCHIRIVLRHSTALHIQVTS